MSICSSTNANDVYVEDFDEKDGFISTFRCAVKAYSYFLHISFLETCKFIDIRPAGIQIKKQSFIEFRSQDMIASWQDTIESTERQLLDTLLMGIAEKMMEFEIEFWSTLQKLEGEVESMDQLIEWWVKLSKYLEKEEKRIVDRKRRKIRKLVSGNVEKASSAMKRFDEHLKEFVFKKDLNEHITNLYPDFENLVNLLSLDETIIDSFQGRESTVSSESSNSDEAPTLNRKTAVEVEPGGRLEGVFISDNILNLSKRELNDAEISLLSKGLKFVPTPSFVDRAAIKTDLERFGRRLRLAWHFRDDDRPYIHNPFKSKSKFDPKGKDAAIEIYLSRLEEEILDINTKIKYHNVTREERKAIESLRNDKSIIIKEADKGSGIVIWDREDYLKEAESQLSDENVYERLVDDNVSTLVQTIKSCLNKINDRGDISQETLDYFLVNNPKLGRFYLLPKIHKRLYDVPGRPVISNSSFYTENISAFLDFHLKPLSTRVKSFIKDTNDFLRKLSSLPPLSQDVLLCTVDVVGLYPNIPHDEGLQALKLALDEREDKKVSTESLLELASCVLKNNYFEHNGEIFKQKRGTAIGTKMAPSYAILFMDMLERDLLENSLLKPSVWWRYIDDVFLLWEHGEESLKEFLTYLNAKHPSIKFTADYSSTEINFLDVKVSRKGDKLVTDLYVKPTDTHQYLEATSCHPAHCKTSIPYSQALRLNRICSEPKSFDIRCDELEKWLLKRGYCQKMVRKKVLQGRKFSREDLLKQEKREKKYKLTLTITFHPAFQDLYRILRKAHTILACDKAHQKVFQDVPLVGFRKGKSLKDLLVRAKVPSLGEAKIGQSGPCFGKRCGVCPFVKNTQEFASKNGRKYVIRGSTMNCSSSHVVYLLSCKTCGVQYVGSCTTPFRSRFSNYKPCNKYHKDKTVPQQELHNHFDLPGHNGFLDFEYTLIDQADSLENVRKKERFWQYKLDTFLPQGLNDREVVVPD